MKHIYSVLIFFRVYSIYCVMHVLYFFRVLNKVFILFLFLHFLYIELRWLTKIFFVSERGQKY